MGKCPSNKNSHKKGYSHKTVLRAKFMRKGDDLIHAELRNMVEKLPKFDEDLPGMGQFYCLHCDRHFGSVFIRDGHLKTKLHRKRLKLMRGAAPHTQVDAEVAAGKGRCDNGAKLRNNSDVLPVMEWSNLTVAAR